MDRPEQTEIDFPRSEQLAIIRDARLKPQIVMEKTVPIRVSAAAQKSLLKALDDFGRGRECWPSMDTLARVSGLSRRHVPRAKEALKLAGLLIVERGDGGGRRRDLNYYLIIWTALAIRAGRLTPPPRGAVKERAPPHGAVKEPASPHGAVKERAPPHGAVKEPASPHGAVKEPAPPHGASGSATVPGGSATVPGGSATVPGGSATVALKTCIKRKGNETSSSSALWRAEIGSDRNSWEEVEEAFSASKMSTAVSLAREARARGIDAALLLALADVYRANQDRWDGPGALWHRVRNFRGGQKPDDLSLWPAATRGYVSAAARERRQVFSAAALQDERSADRRARHDLERAHGAALDAMGESEIAELASAMPELGKFFMRQLSERPLAGLPREILLQQIAALAAARGHLP